jgi:hypothetical protein
VVSESKREADTKLEFGFGFLARPVGSVVRDVAFLFAEGVMGRFSFENYDLGLNSLRVIWVDTEQPFALGFTSRLKRTRALEVQVAYRGSDLEALPNLEFRARYMAMLGVEGLSRGLSTHRVVVPDAFRLVADVTQRLHRDLDAALARYRAKCEQAPETLAYVPNIGKAPAPGSAPKLWFGHLPASPHSEGAAPEE